jgi:hypothetical protein
LGGKMTQKELLYLEDAIHHEHILINICNETINQLEDEDLISFIENEISIHEVNKKNLMELMEECANE